DWSSDVCSSDLPEGRRQLHQAGCRRGDAGGCTVEAEFGGQRGNRVGRGHSEASAARNTRTRPPSPGSGKTRPRHRRSRGRTCCVTDRKSTRLNSSHVKLSYGVFCLKKKRRCEPGSEP